MRGKQKILVLECEIIDKKKLAIELVKYILVLYKSRENNNSPEEAILDYQYLMTCSPALYVHLSERTLFNEIYPCFDKDFVESKHFPRRSSS
jgi:hypothetical protein